MSRLAFRGRITAPSDLLSCLELLITSRNSSLIRPNHARLPPRPVRLVRTTHLPRCCNFVKTSLRLTWTSAVPRTRNHSSLPLALPLSLPCLGSNQGSLDMNEWLKFLHRMNQTMSATDAQLLFVHLDDNRSSCFALCDLQQQRLTTHTP